MNVSTFTNNHLKNMPNAIDHENKNTLIASYFNVNFINYNKKETHIIFSSCFLTTILHHKIHSLLE